MSYGQYVSSVGYYSSEYGLGNSSPQLYCASNLIGKPSCYPASGDDPRVYSLCEFGEWWSTCPSALPTLPLRRPPRIPALAFIDLKFAEAVVPEQVDIFETCESGTVVRIWAWEATTADSHDSACSSGRWLLLYDGQPCVLSAATARKFSPPLRSIDVPVTTLRLELNYTLSKHYPCIDAILLTGSSKPPADLKHFQHFPSQIFAANCTSVSPNSNHSSDHVCDGSLDGSGAMQTHESLDNLTSSLPVSGLINCEDNESRDQLRINERTCSSATVDFVPNSNTVEDLANLNICNKVVMHGLQNQLRHIASCSIENLVQFFGGSSAPSDPVASEEKENSCSQLPSFAHEVENLTPTSNIANATGTEVQKDYNLKEYHQQAVLNSGSCEPPEQDVDFFQMLPPEVMLRVLSLLDLRSLCRIAQSCCALRQLAYHPQLYTHLSLKDWWSVVNDRALTSLLTRLTRTNNRLQSSSSVESGNCISDHNNLRSGSTEEINNPNNDADVSCPNRITSNNSSLSNHESPLFMSLDEDLNTSFEGHLSCIYGTLQSLDLSWCGLYGGVSCPTFLDFIHKCGPKLRILRLSCCDFVDSYCLYMIANVCQHLTELDISRCYQLDFLGLGELKKLSQLTRLDVSYTSLRTDTAHVLLQHLPHLRHLSIRGCQDLRMDEVCVSLSLFCPALESLVAWKTKGVTHRGLRALAELPCLRDLDLGWAFANANGLAGSVTELTQRCQQLCRLRLTACRYLSDADVSSIASSCPRLEQLDLTGNANISADAVESVLQSCRRLRLLEVSYCAMIPRPVTDAWRRRYPAVLIVAACDAHHAAFV
ncbi:F-box/LRR-repeat protein 4 isoform X2 [Hyalella azteca]|uniref:F-box/LRR-repeat protein 4 isoform X2 n=1 Tax=Hyalella azteca TaxID=294128 RepID=A0A979FJN4_HYAAZ|nr:F-box/LRR-repeat protein 4 isoform X2 [Hyalella azteca]